MEQNKSIERKNHNVCGGQDRKLMRRCVIWGIVERLFLLCFFIASAVVYTGCNDGTSVDIVVPRDFATIQEAVDAAQPGDTIKVREGTYTEEIVINKDLTLKGSGISKTIIKAPSALTPFAVHLEVEPVVAVVLITDGANVSVSGFTVTGPLPCGLSTIGIATMKAATLELADSHVTRIRPEDGNCPPAPENFMFGHGVFIGFPPFFEIDDEEGSTGHGTVTRVVVDKYQSHGIVVGSPPGGSPSTATISHNVITGGVPVIRTVVQTGIQVGFGSEGRVTENTVRGNVCTVSSCGPDPINQFQSSGILPFFIGEDAAEFSNNHVSDNDIGIYELASPNCCVISKNKVKNNRFFGIVIQDGDGATSENTIKGGEVGIGVVADFVDTVGVLQGDKIKQTSVAPVQEIECCGFTATAIVE